MTSKNWTTDNIPDQSGRVAIVTGASSGIGFEAVRVLAAKGADVVMAVRNIEKGENAKRRINAAHPGVSIQVVHMDLTHLASVHAFTDGFVSGYQRLDLLINNAGVMIPPHGRTTDGFELQLGTNHLGHFVLTARLMPLLRGTKGSRIVNVSSLAHRIGKLDFNDLNWRQRKYKKWAAYGDSKIANLYFTFGLAKRLGATRTIAAAAHPGWTATELQRHTPLTAALNHIFAQTIRMGALPTLRAATDPDTANGDFFGPDGWMEVKGYPRLVSSNARARDAEIATRLWFASEELTQEPFRI